MEVFQIQIAIICYYKKTFVPNINKTFFNISKYFKS